MKISVAIPTYKRPDYLIEAFNSVLSQERKPFEVIIVRRSGDSPTKSVVERLHREYSGLTIVDSVVDDPGFLPPIVKAIDAANGEILVFLDDDAEAHPDWLRKIVDQYSDPKIGGVGGRYVNFFDGIKQEYPSAKTVGKLFWFGRSVGNMYCDCTFTDPVEVDFLIGGNSSYRLGLLKKTIPDLRLGKNVAFHWEMDVGLGIKRLGYKLMFSPDIKVDHHSAPREIEGMRSVNYEGIYWSNYNYTLIMKKYLKPGGFVAYLIYSFLIGWSGSPGIAYVLFKLCKLERISWSDSIKSSILGRIRGSIS